MFDRKKTILDKAMAVAEAMKDLANEKVTCGMMWSVDDKPAIHFCEKDFKQIFDPKECTYEDFTDEYGKLSVIVNGSEMFCLVDRTETLEATDEFVNTVRDCCENW